MSAISTRSNSPDAQQSVSRVSMNSVDDVEERLQLAIDDAISPRMVKKVCSLVQNSVQNLVVQLKQENRRLSLRVAELELTKGKSTTGSTGDSNVVKNSVVTSAGTSFQFLYSPFPTTDLFSAEHPKPLFGPFDIICYSNLDNKELGPVAEIFTHIVRRNSRQSVCGNSLARRMCLRHLRMSITLPFFMRHKTYTMLEGFFLEMLFFR